VLAASFIDASAGGLASDERYSPKAAWNQPAKNNAVLGDQWDRKLPGREQEGMVERSDPLDYPYG
jgi:hypothetical protein